MESRKGYIIMQFYRQQQGYMNGWPSVWGFGDNMVGYLFSWKRRLKTL